MKKWLYKFIKKKYQVSVIIPTYKNTEFLLECLNSVIISCKKCCEFEILLGIDNCQDTLKFVSLYSIFKNKNISVYYFPKNVGPYIIRNSLASKAKYDNLLFFDSDDVMMQDTVKIIMENFNNKELLKFKFYNFQDGTDYNDFKNLSLSSIFAHASFLIKKEKFLKMNGFFGWKCGADAEFAERYEGQGHEISTLDVPIYYRRYHTKNITKLPETNLTSKLRNRYGEIIIKNRINKKWNNPEIPFIFKSNVIKI